MAENEEHEEETIMEEREALIVSPKGGNPSLRIAHFLKPTIKQLTVQILPSLPLYAPPRPPLNHNVSFNGWNNPEKKWKSWFDRMHPNHQSSWQKARIHDAITISTFKFHKDTNLILQLAQQWCPETNTFVFPWGEATVTLEDVMMLGGFSVLGDSVSKPLETPELLEIEKELINQRKLLIKGSSRKATQTGWMKQSMESDSIFEHEAFLALWLSMFVVPSKSRGHFGHSVFSIAIHLARGTQIALAPAVLAAIYRDLRVIKQAILNEEHVSNLGVSAPFQLLQLWAFERLPPLQPIPSSINPSRPRSERWNNVKPRTCSTIFEIISSKESFVWRPYNNNYKRKEGWVFLDSFRSSDFDEELLSFYRCLRASELVGLDCIEQYLPHRVSMQFGFDQDLPGHASGLNVNEKLAWRNYSKPVYDERLYVPPLQFEAGVTFRYMDWWEEQIRLGGSKAKQSGERKLETNPEKIDANERLDANVRVVVKNEESNDFAIEIMATEERICKLEKVYAALEAAKFGKRI